MSEGYAMFYSSAYAKRTHWPRAESLAVMFCWVATQRLRLHASEEMWSKEEFLESESGLSGRVPASELADQRGNQTWKCHCRSPALQTIFHHSFVPVESHLLVLPFWRVQSSTAPQKDNKDDLIFLTVWWKVRNVRMFPFNFLNHNKRKNTIFVSLIFILLCLCFAQDVPLQRRCFMFQSIYENPFSSGLRLQVCHGCSSDNTTVSVMVFMLEYWKLHENPD